MPTVVTIWEQSVTSPHLAPSAGTAHSLRQFGWQGVQTGSLDVVRTRFDVPTSTLPQL
jgi:hypothetical protein